MKVSDLVLTQFPYNKAKEFDWIAIAYPSKFVVRREAHSKPISSNLLADGVDYFEEKPRAIGNRTPHTCQCACWFPPVEIGRGGGHSRPVLRLHRIQPPSPFGQQVGRKPQFLESPQFPGPAEFHSPTFHRWQR